MQAPEKPDGRISDASYAQFASELPEALARLPLIFGNAHGDRIVASALMNPEIGVGFPHAVLDGICASHIVPGELWTTFKKSGGTSKALEPYVDEHMQHDALRATWTNLVQRRHDSQISDPPHT